MTVTEACGADVSYPAQVTINSAGVATYSADTYVLHGSGDGAYITYTANASTCQATLDASGNGSCEFAGIADNGVAYRSSASIIGGRFAGATASVPASSCGQ